MKIQSVSPNTNFNAHIDSRLKKAGENYYLQRQMTSRYDLFKRKVEEISCYGQEDTVILMKQIPLKNNRSTYLLCLKNININNKEALVLKKTVRFRDILQFITNLRDYSLLQYEEMLEKI